MGLKIKIRILNMCHFRFLTVIHLPLSFCINLFSIWIYYMASIGCLSNDGQHLIRYWFQKKFAYTMYINCYCRDEWFSKFFFLVKCSCFFYILNKNKNNNYLRCGMYSVPQRLAKYDFVPWINRVLCILAIYLHKMGLKLKKTIFTHTKLHKISLCVKTGIFF